MNFGLRACFGGALHKPVGQIDRFALVCTTNSLRGGNCSYVHNYPSRVNRRQFEVCVFRQLVQELESVDICVPGSDTYLDSREQLLSTDECNEALAEYGELVGLPFESQSFVDHLRTQLTDAANAVDRDYLSNTKSCSALLKIDSSTCLSTHHDRQTHRPA